MGNHSLPLNPQFAAIANRHDAGHRRRTRRLRSEARIDLKSPLDLNPRRFLQAVRLVHGHHGSELPKPAIRFLEMAFPQAPQVPHLPPLGGSGPVDMDTSFGNHDPSLQSYSQRRATFENGHGGHMQNQFPFAGKGFPLPPPTWHGYGQGSAPLPPPPGPPPAMGKGFGQFPPQGLGGAQDFDQSHQAMGMQSKGGLRGYYQDLGKGTSKGYGNDSMHDYYQDDDGYQRQRSPSPRKGKGKGYTMVECIECGTSNRHYWSECNGCGTDLRRQQHIDRLRQEHYDLQQQKRNEHPELPRTAPLLDHGTEMQYLGRIDMYKPPEWFPSLLKDEMSDDINLLRQLKAQPPWYPAVKANPLIKLATGLEQFLDSLPPLPKQTSDIEKFRNSHHPSPFNGGEDSQASAREKPFVNAVGADLFSGLRSSNPFDGKAGNVCVQMKEGDLYVINNPSNARHNDIVMLDEVDANSSERWIVKAFDIPVKVSVPIVDLAICPTERYLQHIACRNPLALIQGLMYAFTPQDPDYLYGLDGPQESALNEVTELLVDNAKQASELKELVTAFDSTAVLLQNQHTQLLQRRFDILHAGTADDADALTPSKIFAAIPRMRLPVGVKDSIAQAVAQEIERLGQTVPDVKMQGDGGDVLEFGDMDPEERQKLQAAAVDVKNAEQALKVAEARLAQADAAVAKTPSNPKNASPAVTVTSESSDDVPIMPSHSRGQRVQSPKTPPSKQARLAVGSPIPKMSDCTPTSLRPVPSPADAAASVAPKPRATRRER